MDQRPMMRALRGETLPVPPVWLMRQAGRYLPEYRAVRAKAGSFLELCYTPELAAEVTLQPIRRYGFDAAILFADILLVPHALGASLEFIDGEGPRLSTVTGPATSRACARPRRARHAGAGLRHRARGPRGASGRDGSDRLRRRALDGRDLHGRGPGHDRPGARARADLRRPGELRGADRAHHRGHHRLPARPDRSRRRGRQALRFLGGRACPDRSSSAGASRPPAASSRRCARRTPGFQSSAFRAAPARATRASPPQAGSTAWRSTPRSTRPGPRPRCSRWPACRATSTRCCWWSAARRCRRDAARRRRVRRRPARLQPRPRDHPRRRPAERGADAEGNPWLSAPGAGRVGRAPTARARIRRRERCVRRARQDRSEARA